MSVAADSAPVAVHTSAQLRNCSIPAQNERSCDCSSESPKDVVERLHKRARAKMIATATAASLWQEVFGTGSPLQWAYGRSLYCASVADQHDGQVKSRFCKNRWCPVCGRIRTGKMVERYAPLIRAWGAEGFMVTLSARNVPGPQLSARLDEMKAHFDKCKDSMRKRPDDPVVLRAIRALEITYNGEKDTYHPHYHVTVYSEHAAQLLRDYWLTKWGKEADMKGQDVSPLRPGSERELFKYSTKLLTDKKPVPAKNLDVMLCALRGRRTIQTVGFTIKDIPTWIERLSPPADAEDDQSADDIGELTPSTPALTRQDEDVTWTWVQAVGDWVDLTTGEVLSGYTPSEAFRALCERIATTEEVFAAEDEAQHARHREESDLRRRLDAAGEANKRSFSTDPPSAP